MNLFSARWRRALTAIVLLVASAVPANAQDQRRLYSPPDATTLRGISAEHGMVVAQEKIAAQFGADILRQGGNAVDAAVATGFALAVTYPRAGNIGGGGFMVIHSAERNADVAIDYRETAPSAATRDMFLGAASACPARSPDWRWRWRNMVRATSHSRRS
jgi:gamma-glutamyltranspeptidase/glutathione hydrolase